MDRHLSWLTLAQKYATVEMVAKMHNNKLVTRLYLKLSATTQISEKEKMTFAPILSSEDPRLRLIASPVLDVFDVEFRQQSELLKFRLDAFRQQYGFGRGIAAPQLGISKRFIALNLGQGSFTLINPEIIWRSAKTFTMWDDCMCFPDTLVKVRRSESISLRFIDENGETIEWQELDRSLSELLQHELDHLDGILALDLALDDQSKVSRQEFESHPAKFQCQVDYVIPSPAIA